jgi:hypothetical protein
MTPAGQIRVGDKVRLDPLRSAVSTVATSEPDDLNAGWWHLEMHEPDPDSEGWPESLRCPPDYPIDKVT